MDVPSPPYDEATISSLVGKLDPNNGSIPFDSVTELWMSKGATDKNKRTAAVTFFLKHGIIVHDDESNTLTLVDRGSSGGDDDDGEDDGKPASTKAKLYSSLHPRIASRIFLASTVMQDPDFHRVQFPSSSFPSPSSLLYIKFLRKGKKGATSPLDENSEMSCVYVGSYYTADGLVEFGRTENNKPMCAQVKDTILAWRMVMPLLCDGDAVEIACTSCLAYKERGSHPIPGFASLWFKIGIIAGSIKNGKPAEKAHALLAEAIGIDRDSA